MNEINNCEICGTEFTFYWNWRHTCFSCRKVICDKCSENYFTDVNIFSEHYNKKLEYCNICYEYIKNEIKNANEIIVVSSGHVGSHTIIEKLSKIVTRRQYKNFEHAKFELQYSALKLGGNAVLNYHYEKHQHSELSENGKGKYYYNMFSASGEVAIVKKNK